MRDPSSAVFKIFLLFFVLTWALPEADEPGQSHSGNSLDDIIAQLLRVFPTQLREDEKFIDSHKGSVTQGFSQCLSAEYPRKNVLIYHHQDSIFEGTNAVHRSIELPSDSATAGQHTYDIQIFDSGTFKLAGEDGYHNWAFAGNWSQKANVVKFYPLEESLAIYRSGRTGAKLGGGYLLPSERNTANLDARDSGSPWTVNDSPPREDFPPEVFDENPDAWETLLDPEAYGITEPEVFSSQLWSPGGQLLADSSALGPEAVAVVVAVAAFVTAAGLLIDALVSWAHRNANERSFTQATAAQLASALPDKNAIIFHNQDSRWSFVGWTHVHHELKLHNFMKQTVGYEVYSFDYGNFSLAGDGGYENWAFFGNWYREEHSPNVVFYPRADSGCSLMPSMARGLDSEQPIRLRQLIPPQKPSRQHADMTDGYYFVDCVKPDKTLAKGLAHYKDMEPGGGNVGQLPDDFVEIHSNHAGMKAWQGEGDVLLRATGTSFHWNFMHQDNKDEHVTVGTAHTNTEQFWLYKDTGMLLFNSTAEWACSSSYYAF